MTCLPNCFGSGRIGEFPDLSSFAHQEEFTMKRKYSSYSGNEKVAILKRHPAEKVSASDLCDEYLLNPTVFYRWQKDFSENGAAAFEKSNARRQRGERKHVEELLRLNGLKPASAIHPGQKLLVGSSRAINLFVNQTPASLAIRILRQTDPFKKQQISKAPSSHLPIERATAPHSAGADCNPGTIF
jgi:transposase